MSTLIVKEIILTDWKDSGDILQRRTGMKRKLSARGGIRRKKLHLFIGEYVWKYNHRNLNFKEREKLLFKLIIKYFWFE